MTDMAIAQFRRLYEVWRNEEASSWIREDEVEPLVSVPSFHDAVSYTHLTLPTN